MNALVHTLVVGGLVWGLGLGTNSGRVARGEAAAYVWTVLFAYVATLVALAARRHRSLGHPLHATAAERVRRGARLVREIAFPSLGAVLLLAIGIPALGAGDFGIDQDPALTIGVLVMPWLLPLVAAPFVIGAFSVRVRTLLRVPPPPDVVPPSPRAYVLALLPMLLPAVALAWLYHAPVPDELVGRVEGKGLAGILFLQLETLALPAALVVACALDASDGSRARFPYPAYVVGISLFSLAVASLVPVVVGAGSTLAHTVVVDGESRVEPLEVDFILRGAAAMLLACSLASGGMLWLMGRARARPAG
ncbi:MAG: hypothetical protein H6825_02130 [Planctomycetes bacterium]|nr:hypothetical protein [Planctomycetota bacterium]